MLNNMQFFTINITVHLYNHITFCIKYLFPLLFILSSFYVVFEVLYFSLLYNQRETIILCKTVHILVISYHAVNLKYFNTSFILFCFVRACWRPHISLLSDFYWSFVTCLSAVSLPSAWTCVRLHPVVSSSSSVILCVLNFFTVSVNKSHFLLESSASLVFIWVFSCSSQPSDTNI